MKNSGRKSLIPHLTPMQAWGFALGTAVGWGSLVVTANSYLAQAGPWGSAIGLIIGMAVMLLVARNYAYLMNIYPEPGGAYAYSREVFGHDHGFLTGWFLALTYLAILWANATSVPLFFRNFVGNWFRFGRMYTLFGYDVYIGEALLTIACLFGVALLCTRGWKAAVKLMPVCAFVFIGGIAVVLVSALLGLKAEIAPGFLPDPSELRQIIAIAVISPWAFIGFECISHASAEFSFPRTKSFKLLAVSVVSATALYVALFVLSVTAYPARYDSWLAYIRDLGACEGLEAFLAFYAAQQTLGGLGVDLLMAALLALVLSSLIGNTMALSRLFYALGRDKVLPGKFGELNEDGEPARAIMLIACVSAVIPFAGRTAVGWIVDVTTIGATLIYGFVSAAAAKTARLRKDRKERLTGLIGLILMVAFGCYILLPNLVGRGSMAKETYFLFIIWTLLGFLFFRDIMHREYGAALRQVSGGVGGTAVPGAVRLPGLDAPVCAGRQ